MHIFVGIIGILAILFGVIVFVNGASAIHEIEGLLACGFGGLFLGLSSIDRHLAAIEKRLREEAGEASAAAHARDQMLKALRGEPLEPRRGLSAAPDLPINRRT